MADPTSFWCVQGNYLSAIACLSWACCPMSGWEPLFLYRSLVCTRHLISRAVNSSWQTLERFVSNTLCPNQTIQNLTSDVGDKAPPALACYAIISDLRSQRTSKSCASCFCLQIRRHAMIVSQILINRPTWSLLLILLWNGSHVGGSSALSFPPVTLMRRKCPLTRYRNCPHPVLSKS